MSAKAQTGRIVAPLPEWLPQLELAVREVFEIMVDTKVVPATQKEPDTYDFTSMVGLAGDLCGMVTLCCSTKCATAIAAKMLGSVSSDAEEQMWDAVGEVTNMIAGNFKNKLPGMSSRCLLSVPTVITGSSYHCHSMAGSGSLEVHLKFEEHPIEVSLEVHA